MGSKVRAAFHPADDPVLGVYVEQIVRHNVAVEEAAASDVIGALRCSLPHGLAVGTPARPEGYGLVGPCAECGACL